MTTSLNPKAAWPFPKTREELEGELAKARQYVGALAHAAIRLKIDFEALHIETCNVMQEAIDNDSQSAALDQHQSTKEQQE